MAEDGKKTERTEKVAEVDYSTLDPTRIPHEVVEQTKAFSGLLQETQGLRTSGQQLADANLTLTQQLEEKEPEPDPELDEDEPVTRKDIQGIIAAEKEKEKTEQQKAQAQQVLDTQNESYNKLVAETTPEKVGEGMDAETVLRKGIPWLRQHKSRQFNAAWASGDMREVYEEILAHCPEFKEKVATVTHQKFLETLNTGAVPRGQASASDEGVTELAKILEKPMDELLEEAEADELKD